MQRSIRQDYVYILLITLLFAAIHSGASAEGPWQLIQAKDGWGTIYLDTSILHGDLDNQGKAAVLVVNTKTELSPFGAGVFTGFMQALQKKHPEQYPGVDFAKVHSINYTYKLNAAASSIATEAIWFCDAAAKKIFQYPQQKLEWKPIEPESDEDLLAQAVLAIQADKDIKQ